MRPAGNLKLWTGGYVNRPGVGPPGYLRFILVLCTLSLIGTLFYAVFAILGHVGDPRNSAIQLAVEAVILFILPFSILYTISTNNPLSRILLLAYFGVTIFAIANYNYSLVDTMTDPILVVFLLFMLVTVFWLFLSSRSRVYYALIRNSPVPEELEHLVEKYVAPGPVELWIRRLGAVLEPFSPVLIILISIILVVAGFRNLSPR